MKTLLTAVNLYEWESPFSAISCSKLAVIIVNCGLKILDENSK
jgi:hypothetical protein